MKNTVVFIGNSIVNGFPLSRGRSFPGLIRAAVRDGEVSFDANVINKGVNGETTADILRRFETDVLEHQPTCVFIMTGTNDFIFREKDPAGCMENLEKMAGMAEEAGIIPVHLIPLPVHAQKAGRMWMSGLGIDYDRVNADIAALSELIRSSGRRFVDTGAAWAEYASDDGEHGGESDGAEHEMKNAAPRKAGAPDGRTNAAEDGSTAANQPLGDAPGMRQTYREDAWIDGVHPAPEGYAFLAKTILDWMEAHAAELNLK